MKKHIISSIACLLCIFAYGTERHWETHFAYNSVQLLALDCQEQVYALANGKLFSIDPTSEKITKYNNFSGMHGVDIAHIAYDAERQQMVIMYRDGKIDIWHSNKQMQYISDLYSKQMTSSKNCNNITIAGNMAYLAMDFGILTMDLEQYELVDTYYIGPEASEVIVNDIMISGDSIYAKVGDLVYAAHMEDNIVDYRYWTSRPASSIVFDTKKGKEYTTSNGDKWKVAGAKGVERQMSTKEKVYYLPDGPEMNTPYSLTWSGGRLWMVPGGRWVNQNQTPGHVMIYENGKWKNLTNSALQAATNNVAVTDLTGVAVDKDDPTHFWISSYGTGLYEFKNDSLVNRYTAVNSIMGSAAPNSPDRYTRVENPTYDDQGVLWVTIAGGIDTTLVAFLPDGTQRGVNFYTGVDQRYVINTPGGLLIDEQNPDRKWAISSRAEPGVVILDDGGTRYYGGDDQSVVRTEFRDQDGLIINPEFFFGIDQGADGSVWIASSAGPIIIPQDIDPMQTNDCVRLRIPMPDGTYLLEAERINTFEWDDKGQVWIGTQTGGVYVLDATYSEIVACYTSSNSAMPSNSVLSLAYNEEQQQMFIGTSGGLVSYIADPDTYSTLDEEDLASQFIDGSMFRWRAHNAFTYVEQIACMDNKVYALSANSLFSVDKNTHMVSSHTKLDGMSASNINHIAYNPMLNRLLVTYTNGQIDIITHDGEIYNISDLFLKQMSASKEVNDIHIHQDKAYLAMSFGIMVINMRKMEIEDTYYIGSNSSEVHVEYITILDNTIYALASGWLYSASLQDNLVDYTFWNTNSIPSGKAIQGMDVHNDRLYLAVQQKLYYRDHYQWVETTVKNVASLQTSKDELYIIPTNQNGIAKIDSTYQITWMLPDNTYHAIAKDGNAFWLGSHTDGLVRYDTLHQTRESFYPDGPISNFSYRIRFFDDRLYMLPGGRWANQFRRQGDVMIFENDQWTNIKNKDLVAMAPEARVQDFMNVAQDPIDPQHFFVTSYASGLYEFYKDSIVEIYLPHNSTLRSSDENNPMGYTRTDGAIYDDQGNLWVLNMGGNHNIHILTPQGQWHSFDAYYNGKKVEMHTTGEILIDQRNPQHKWIPLLRYNTGLVLLNDNGTPTEEYDDVVVYRTEWKDQNNNLILPTTIHTIAQDHNNVIWVGTGSGIFAIPAGIDIATSNKCIRVIIPRNDGTQLGDYLLDNEQINDIKIDGANRLWVGTANSGVFLFKPVSDYVDDPSYYVETVAHFTTENSILPSNEVLSIAIHETTGEVFFATGGGLVSYMSDATPAHDDYSQIYAYPNPVLPNFRGYITFKGLMDNTELRIVDAGGNLIKKIHSEGGTAIWDAKNARGERVASGVYTAICNTSDGQHNGAVKVMIFN